MLRLGFSPARYETFLLSIAAMSGFLYGIDIGIIAAALLFLSKTIELTPAETSLIVAAVLGGGMVSCLAGGLLADRFGRRKMMISGGLLFIVSVAVIVGAHGFVTLLLGRLLQGASGGVIAVVAPLYLAECLPPEKRGRGAAIFQLMLTIGIVVAALTGWFYTRQADKAVQAAKGDAALILAAENHAWRVMFSMVVYPGVVFFIGAFGLCESPRWLFRRGRKGEAKASLRRVSSEEVTELQMAEMEALTRQEASQSRNSAANPVLQKKYIAPFLLACSILALNQSTGINSVLGFLVLILRHAGMTARQATAGDVAVKALNCLGTVAAVFLVDRKGRKFLLEWGTAGLVAALALCALLFYGFESKRVDVKARILAAKRGNEISLPLTRVTRAGAAPESPEEPSALTVLYSYGSGDRVAVARNDGGPAVFSIQPSAAEANRPLLIRSAEYGPLPSPRSEWLLAGALGLYMVSFAIGPGVVVWLALSELMPLRIRSGGMGIALLINQGAATLIAALFLPAAGRFGYAAIFASWSAATVIYFLIAVFLLPETKGKTLEEIEAMFEGASASKESIVR